MAELTVRRLGYALGAEIRGVDLRQPLDDATANAINRVFLDNLMISIPDQDLTRAQFEAACARFGPLDLEAPVRQRDTNNPGMFVLTNKPVNGKPWDGYKDGVGWHSDRSVGAAPTPRSFGLMKEVPDVGGGTLFANQYMAYEALSPKMQAIAEQVSFIHDVTKFDAYEKQGTQTSKHYPYPAVVHPAVRVHPETGRKALYVGRGYRIVGMTVEESQPFLEFFREHEVRYEFCYRHTWQPDEFVIWDNRALLHNALVDYELTQPRVLWRAAEAGPVTGRYLSEIEAEHTEGELVAG